jgi:heme-degrading monooxygenase HmoA
MVLEVADFRVLPGHEEAFIAAYRQARRFVAESPGVGTIRMTRGIETPTRFVLLIEWDDVASHDAFRSGEGFTGWRALIGPHFDGAPHVEHVADV